MDVLERDLDDDYALLHKLRDLGIEEGPEQDDQVGCSGSAAVDPD